jgi:hypothetical protein
MTISKFIKSGSSALLAFIILTSCESDYTKMVKSELAKGVHKDSVLLGINLGSTKQEFFGKCFDLNKQEMVTQGQGGFVQYFFMDSVYSKTPSKIRLLFLPTFDQNDSIAEVNMEFSYASWSPWARPLQSDSLKIVTLKILKDWYKGNDFVIAHMKDQDIPAKVDGNRRVLVFIKDHQTVNVRVQDILHPMFRHKL